MGEFWGAAGEPVPATIDGVPVTVDVEVSDEDEVRIKAWTPGGDVRAEIVFAEVDAPALRDLLAIAVREGRWLA